MEPVHVINPDGQLGTIDPNELQTALGAGYKMATPGEVQAAQKLEEAGSGFGPLIAGTEAAASAATLGLSREVERAFGRTSEAQALTAEANPVATQVGTGLGVVGSLLVAPEAGAAKGLLGATEGAAGGIKALGEALPINLASKAGRAVSEAVSPAVAKGVSIVANPETRPIANAILRNAGSMASGSAVEGMIFGLGQSVDENALGDPDALGEKLFANIGFGAALGGGLGGLVGAGVGTAEGLKATKFKDMFGRFSEEAPMTMNPSDQKAVQAGDLEAAARNSKMPDKGGFIEELKNAIDLKRESADASKIRSVAAENGLEVMPYQTTDSQIIKRGGDWLLSGQPTISSIEVVRQAERNFQKAADIVSDQVVANGERMSELQFGNYAKDYLTKKLDEKISPLEELYDSVKEYHQAIPINEKGIKQISNNIEKLFEKSPNSPAAKMARDLVSDLPLQQTIEDLRQRRIQFTKSISPTASAEEKYYAGIIADKLKDAEERYITNFAEEKMMTTAARDKVLSQIEKVKEANKGYRAMMEEMSEISEGLGKKRLSSGRDLENFIEEMNPQSLAKKMLQKGNLEYTQMLEKKFPDLYEAVRKYEKDKIFDASLTPDGAFNPKTFFNKYHKMEPEHRELLFTKDQQKRIEGLETYIRSFPKKFNPSETGYTEAFQKAFEGPVEYGKATVRDKFMKMLMDYSTKVGDAETAQNIYTLHKIEKKARVTSDRIGRGVKGIVSGTRDFVHIEGIKEHEYTPEQHKKVVEMVAKYNADPEHFMNTLSDQTEALYGAAPKTAQSIQGAMARANTYLASKIPSGGQQSYLSGQYEPSKAEMAKFERYHAAITNPLGILIQAQKGTLTPESVEAVQTVMPRLMEEIRGKVMEEMSKKGNNLFTLPLNKKLGLSLLMGTDLFNGLHQDRLAANQASLANPGAQQAAMSVNNAVQVSQAGLSKLTVAHREMTDVDRAANRKMLS